MKLNLLAAEETRKDTIDHLVEGVKRVIPVPIDISVMDERYKLTYFPFQDITDIARDYISNFTRNNWLLMLTHTSLSFQDSIGVRVPVIVGEYKGDFIYGGAYDFSKLLIAGIENSPEDNNVKIAAHEAGHALMWHLPGFESDEVHCNGYSNGRRCVMNTQYENDKATRSFMHTLDLGFCNNCTETIQLLNDIKWPRRDLNPRHLD